MAANAEHLKALIQSHMSGDETRFEAVTLQNRSRPRPIRASGSFPLPDCSAQQPRRKRSEDFWIRTLRISFSKEGRSEARNSNLRVC